MRRNSFLYEHVPVNPPCFPYRPLFPSFALFFPLGLSSKPPPPPRKVLRRYCSFFFSLCPLFFFVFFSIFHRCRDGHLSHPLRTRDSYATLPQKLQMTAAQFPVLLNSRFQRVSSKGCFTLIIFSPRCLCKFRAEHQSRVSSPLQIPPRANPLHSSRALCRFGVWACYWDFRRKSSS